jgi:sec-independent protein translocase protein TatC
MTLLEHLSELRVRLRNAASSSPSRCWARSSSSPASSRSSPAPCAAGWQGRLRTDFAIMSVTEPFWVYMKLAIVAGILIASPFIFWELWKFVAPGLYRKERRLATGVTAPPRSASSAARSSATSSSASRQPTT